MISCMSMTSATIFPVISTCRKNINVLIMNIYRTSIQQLCHK